MNNVKAKIITIGDELLIGQVINTNAAWLGDILNANGIELVSVLTIGDSEDEIMHALNLCSQSADIVLITGGLGPTADDITKPTLCKFFDTKLVLNEDALDNVNKIFALRGYPMTERNRLQATIPEKCTYIRNAYGTAPCMWFEKDSVVYVSMPGVPFEMKSVFEESILPKLLDHFLTTPYAKRNIMTTGIGESFLADKIKDWESALPDFMSLAYLPQYGMVRLRLSGRHSDKAFLNSALDAEVEKLVPLIGEYIFSFEDEPIEKVVVHQFTKYGKTIATAESCTGGNIAHMITSVPGSSAVFNGSVVSYATKIKTKILGVSQADVDRHTVVSQQVAEQMAEGARRTLETDYAVATTGIAGPDGGTEANPVGTVWIAVATPSKTISKRYNFGKNRDNNINRASITALEMLRQQLMSEIKKS